MHHTTRPLYRSRTQHTDHTTHAYTTHQHTPHMRSTHHTLAHATHCTCTRPVLQQPEAGSLPAEARHPLGLGDFQTTEAPSQLRLVRGAGAPRLAPSITPWGALLPGAPAQSGAVFSQLPLLCWSLLKGVRSLDSRGQAALAELAPGSGASPKHWQDHLYLNSAQCA